MSVYSANRSILTAVRRLLWCLLPLVAMTGACSDGGEGVNRVTDPNRLTYVEVPSEWHVYDFDELATLEGVGWLSEYRGLTLPVESASAFDGGPTADVSQVALALAEAQYPTGVSVVRRVPDAEREYLSRDVISQSVLPYKSFEQVEEITKEEFSFGKGVDGIRALISYQEPGVGVGVAYLIAVSDNGDGRVFGIYVGCNLDCFSANQSEIESVVDSWLVSTKA